jgi:hypothetical protein
VRRIFIIMVAVMALALPSAALAQDGYGPSGGVLPEESSGGGGGGPSGTSGGGKPPAATAPATVENGVQSSGGGELPFTGADLLVVAGIGLVLVGAGVGLRRLRANP